MKAFTENFFAGTKLNSQCLFLAALFNLSATIEPIKQRSKITKTVQDADEIATRSNSCSFTLLIELPIISLTPVAGQNL